MNFIELKQQIIDTINKDAKNAEELMSVCAWALSKSKRLCNELEEQSEAELNAFESTLGQGE